MGKAIQHPVPADRVKPSFVISDIRALWLSVRMPRCQKLQMAGLTRSAGTGCFIAVPIWQQWASKG